MNVIINQNSDAIKTIPDIEVDPVRGSVVFGSG